MKFLYSAIIAVALATGLSAGQRTARADVIVDQPTATNVQLAQFRYRAYRPYYGYWSRPYYYYRPYWDGFGSSYYYYGGPGFYWGW